MKRLSEVFRRSAGERTLADRSRTSELAELQAKIGYRFSDEQLLLKALKHRSYVHSKDQGALESNERLEFLGDAVLGLVASEHLYRTLPTQREGDLTRIRSALVSKSVLSQKARLLDLGSHLLLSVPEKQGGGPTRTSTTGDAFEALLAAIYLDGGLDAAAAFLKTHLLGDIQAIASDKDHKNHKSALLEYTQKHAKGQPEYILQAADGPDHRKTFTVVVAIEGQRFGQGTGRSKKEAQQMAARETLRRLRASVSKQGR